MKHDDARERRHIIMMVKAMNNGTGAASMKQSPGTGRRTPKKGSRVTDARAQAQRAKIESQREARQQQQAEQTATQTP